MRRDRQKYKGHEIIKYDLEGNVITKYDSMHLAQLEERISHKRLKSAIDSGVAVRGFIFKYGEIHGSYEKKASSSTLAPWEKHGFFNIDGWAKTAL